MRVGDGTTPRGRRAHLPAQLTSFVGRQRELDDIGHAMAGGRLLTLVGPGGVGKTRLAIAAAERVHRAFADGVWFVDLSTLRDPTLLAEHVAAALGLRDDSGRWLVATLSDHLAERRMLVVVDNCEHILDATAVLVRGLLGAGTGLRIMATSREPLALTGESLIHVAPLSADAEALQLLVDRASAVQPTFRLDDSTRASAVELCRRLDGVPLAIELAASRLRGMGLGELVERLDDRLGLLSTRDRSAPPRQQTLRATLDWSYDLLPPVEQLLLARLSCFAGTFSLSAAIGVCSDEQLGNGSVADGLSHLAERSLVLLEDPMVGRYRLLDTVRAYAADKAAELTELGRLQNRHRDYFLAFARSAAAGMAGADQIAWFRRVSVEYDNLREALERSRGSENATIEAADVASRLWLWWQVAGRVGEGRRWLHAFLETLPPGIPEHRWARFAVGFLALAQRDMETAKGSLERAFTDAQEAHDAEVEAYATGYLALVRLFEGAPDEARLMFHSAVDQHRRDGRRMMAAFALADAAIAATIAGKPVEARPEFEQSIRESRDLGDTWTESHALWGLGLAQLALGEPAAAQGGMERSLELITQVGDATGEALALEGLAMAASAGGDHERAAWLTGLADAFWAAIPASPPPPIVALRASGLVETQRALGDRFSALAARGRTTDPHRAVAEALTGRGPRDEAPNTPKAPVLSRREQEVAAHVSAGMSNREIAERLVVSPRTVESHVQRIMNRLGVNSRTEIATWFVSGGGPSTERRRIQ